MSEIKENGNAYRLPDLLSEIKASLENAQRTLEISQVLLTACLDEEPQLPLVEPEVEAQQLIDSNIEGAAQRMAAAYLKMRARKDGAYEERNRVVAALASCFPSGIARTTIEGWHAEWHGCVYIDLPTGQASWHYHDSQAHLFAHLPTYTKEWDGHTTEEKYERVSRLLVGLRDLPTMVEKHRPQLVERVSRALNISVDGHDRYYRGFHDSAVAAVNAMLEFHRELLKSEG